MKKLDEIPKKEIFQVPEGFFERLPGNIRKKIDAKQYPEWYQSAGLRIAIASIIILLGAYFILVNYSTPEFRIQQELSEITEERILDYLQEADISMIDINAEITISDSVYLEIMEENFHFEGEGIEEEVLLNLEKYSDELL